MAKQSSVNLDITNNPDGFDISGGTTLRKLSVTGGDVTIAGSGGATVTFPTTSTTIAGLGIAQTFTATQTFSAGISASGATFSGNISAPNIVNSLNGFTGAVQVTGSGAILQTVSGTTTTFGARLSTTAVTGVASFDPIFFSVGTSGHIRLAAAYQATGSGIATVPLATTSLTGTASFNPNRFQVSATGNVDLLAAFQVTGQTVVSGGPSQIVSTSGNTVTIDNRIATSSVTGVASFNATRFSVSAAGAVDLGAAFQATGDTVLAGSAINFSTSGTTKTINNIGVTSFNGATGAINFTVPLATTSLTGTASFNPNRFQVSATGNVDLLAAFQVTGQTVVSGGPSQLVSTSGNTVTIDNRVASTSVTGVAAFNATRFTVSAAGAVDLASAFQVTGDTIQAGSFINIGAGKTINNIGVQTLNGATGAVVSIATTGSNVFTGLNSFNAGLSAIGATFSGDIAVQGGDITTSSATATVFNTTATTLSIGSAATTLTIGATGGIATIRNPSLTLGNTDNTITSKNGYLQITTYSLDALGGSFPSIKIDGTDASQGLVNIEGGNLRLGRKTDEFAASTAVNLIFEGSTNDVNDTTLTVVDPTATRTITLPDASGIVALTNSVVTSFNGATGAVAGVTTGGANIFTALNSFNAGLSASGATFANDIKVNGVNIGLGGGSIASNLGIGKGALSGNSGGLFNTAVGSGAMEIGTNSYSVAFGYNALNSCTDGGMNNVALGSSTMTTIGSASNNVAIGSNSSQNIIDGNSNISIGAGSLVSNMNGSFNIAIGHQALYTNGWDLNASNNIAIGYQALYTNDEGQQNTAIGNEALRSIATTGSAERNTAIGYQAGRWKGATGTGVVVNRLNTANDSIFIGWRARSSADAQTNQIVIGNDTVGGGSNTTTIGTTGTIDATIYGKLHGTNGVSGPTASFTSLTVSENTTLGNAATDTTTIHGAKIVNEGVYANGSLRTANISFANGQVQTLTGVGTGATGMTAIYFTGAPSTGAASVTAIITNGGLMTGAGMTSWGGNIKWPGAVKPVLTSSGVDVVSFVTPDAGTTIYGFVGGLGFS